MDAAVTRRNFGIYALVSTAFFLVSVQNAVAHNSNGYTLIIALTQDFHAVITANFFIMVGLVAAKLLQVLLFSQLRLVEQAHIYERSWFSIVNLVLDLSKFRNQNNLVACFLVMFVLFLKIFHGIIVDRMQHIILTQPSIKGAIFSRATLALVLFLFLDYKMISTCIDNMFNNSNHMYLIFGLDFCLMFFQLIEELGKAIFDLIELFRLKRNPGDEVWERKTVYVKFFEVAVSLVKLITIFFNLFVLAGALSMPTIIVQVYMSGLTLISQIHLLLKYRWASQELGKRLHNATEEDLEEDEICPICRDEMEVMSDTNSRHAPKKLSCGHVIHLGCLKSWAERSGTCPMCRAPFFTPEMEDRYRRLTRDNNNNFEDNDGDSGADILAQNMTRAGFGQTGRAQQPIEGSDTIVDERGNIRYVYVSGAERRRRGFMNRIFNRGPTLRNIAEFISRRGGNNANNESNNDVVDANNDSTTPTPTTEPLLTITLPSNSVILPPDWVLLPLNPLPQTDPRNAATTEYEISLNPQSRGLLEIQRVEENHLSTMIPIVRPGNEHDDNYETNNNDNRQESTSTTRRGILRRVNFLRPHRDVLTNISRRE